MVTTPAGFVIPLNTADEGTTAIGIRLAMATLLKQSTPGVAMSGRLGDDHFAVSGSASSMAYNVSGGGIVIVRDSDKGAYIVGVPASMSVATTPSDGVNPRIDRIFARQPDPELDGTGVDVDFVVDVVQGSPAATPVAPTIPSGAVELARKVIAPGVTNTATGAAFTNMLAVTGLNVGELTPESVPNLPASKITSGTLPIARGGTGGATAAAAREALGVQDVIDDVANAASTPSQGQLFRAGTNGRINVGAPTTGSNATTKSYVDDEIDTRTGGKVDKSGDNMTGDLVVYNTGKIATHWGRGNAVSSWLNVGINPDGVIGQTGSARRLKKNIEDIEFDGDFDALRPRQYDWREGGQHDLGMIAEEVRDAGYPELVTRDEDGQVLGLRYEMLPLILIQEVQRLRARVAELEGD